MANGLTPRVIGLSGSFVKWAVQKGFTDQNVSIVPPNPVLQEVASAALRHRNGIVEASQPDTPFHQSIDLVEMRQHRVPLASVGEDHDGGRSVENLRGFRPAVAADDRFDVR